MLGVYMVHVLSRQVWLVLGIRVGMKDVQTLKRGLCMFRHRKVGMKTSYQKCLV